MTSKTTKSESGRPLSSGLDKSRPIGSTSQTSMQTQLLLGSLSSQKPHLSPESRCVSPRQSLCGEGSVKALRFSPSLHHEPPRRKSNALVHKRPWGVNFVCRTCGGAHLADGHFVAVRVCSRAPLPPPCRASGFRRLQQMIGRERKRICQPCPRALATEGEQQL